MAARAEERQDGPKVLEALQDVGFALSSEPPDDADDEDGCRGTGSEKPGLGLDVPRLGPCAILLELQSSDEDSCGQIGFSCAFDGADGIFYACPKTSPSSITDAAGGRVIKCAVSALMDVAEACDAKKLALGLGGEHANCTGFIRALLYLGFSVAPCQQKCVFADSTLVLEFITSAPQDEDPGDDRFSDVSTKCDEGDNNVFTEP